MQHEKRLFWLADCPVLLQSYAITKNNTDNSIFLQCKFENIADKSIKEIHIAVKCFDISQQELDGIDDFSYLDINKQPYTWFGDKTPVILPDAATKNVVIIPLKIVFDDDCTWENISGQAYELAEYEQQEISSLGELADSYKRELHTICEDSGKHKYLPMNQMGFMICGCGKVVLEDTICCPQCGVNFERLRELNCPEKLSLNHNFADNVPADTEEILPDSAINPEEQELIPLDNLDSKPKDKRKIFLLGGIIATAAIIICISISFLSTKPLSNTTTLEDGSVATFKGGYIMETPSYSYMPYYDDFDMKDTEYLCYAFSVENKGTKSLNIKNTFSGEVKENGKELDVSPTCLGETREDEELKIESGKSKDVLLVLPIPKDTDLSNIKSTVEIAGKKYKFNREFTDVREFVRKYEDEISQVMGVLKDIDTAEDELKSDYQKMEGYTSPFAKMLGMSTALNNLYFNTRNLHDTAISVHNELNTLSAPDIPHYQKSLSGLTDYTQNMADKLQCLENMQYPTNLQNLDTNVDSMGEFIDGFPSYFDEVLEVSEYSIANLDS